MLKQILALFAIGFSTTFSSEIHYQISFVVKEFHYDQGNENSDWGNASCRDCYKIKPEIGQEFYGMIALDDSLLQSDGNKVGGLVSLDLNIAGVNWGYSRTSGFFGSLTGFNNNQYDGSHIRINSPNFSIEGGQLIREPLEIA